MLKNNLEKELRYFESIEQELIAKYLNKFVVIKGSELKGVYDTQQEAYIQSSAKFEEGTFLIRQCLKNREPQVFYSRAYLP